MSAVIRKIVTVVEETRMEMGKTVSPPTRRAAAIAVIENPFAGKYVEDLTPRRARQRQKHTGAAHAVRVENKSG